MLNELINHLNEAMSAIQNLQLAPTEHNCSRIVNALNNIREVGNKIIEMSRGQEPKEEPEDATPAVTEEEI